MFRVFGGRVPIETRTSGTWVAGSGDSYEVEEKGGESGRGRGGRRVRPY